MQLVIRTFNNRSTQNFISNLIYIKWIEHWAISVEIDKMMKWHRTPNTTKNNIYVYDNRFNVDALYSSMSNLFARGYDFCVYIYTDILRFFVRVFGFTLVQNRTGAIRAPYGDHTEIVRRLHCLPRTLRQAYGARVETVLRPYGHHAILQAYDFVKVRS